MTPATSTDPELVPAGRPAVWLPYVEIALVLAVFAVDAAWPVPDPNEPYYLSKARHYWNPDWIQGDFFLDSADSHWSFYVVAGWLFRGLSFPAGAWIGRLLTWTLLAATWRQLSWAIVPRAGAAILSAALWVGLNERFHMAGEWVVGGFESKGLAYALVLAALAALVRGRWNLTWLLLGGASALHVLVGGWASIAVGICWLTSCRTERPKLAEMVPGLLGGFAISLAGLIPVLNLTRGVPPDVVEQANQFYAFQRLPHHLSFFGIRQEYRLRFALLILAWGAVARFLPADPGARRLRRVVTASLAMVVIGAGLSLLPDAIAAQWLRFYWFRLADALVPLGVALAVVAAAWRLRDVQPRWGMLLQILLVVGAMWLLSPQIEARLAPPEPRADKRGKVANYEDWRDACQWIAAETPPGARFLTPRTAQTFKWYAQRSEVVTWKDLPQDAASIVAWRERLEDVYGTGDATVPWFVSLAEEGAERLQELGARYDAQYVLTEAEPTIDLPLLYRNKTYAVYKLPN